MNSVSKINVQIGSNAAQFAAGMGQATQSVGKFNAATSRMQMGVQQAAFAVDDFAAGFSTGGLAGGIRGAANNVTALAASIGGLRTQLIAIGGMVALQLAPKIVDQLGLSGRETTDVARNIELLRSRFNALKESAAMAFDRSRMGARVAEIADANQGLERVEALSSEIDRLFRVDIGPLRVAKRTLDDLAANRRLSDQAANWADRFGWTVNGRPQWELIGEERKRVEAELSRETQRVNDLLEERARVMQRVDDLQYESMQNEASLHDQVAQANAEDAEFRRARAIRDALNTNVRMVSDFSAFNRLPSAFAAGSSGAVGVVNTAFAGPGNVRDSSHADVQQLRELQRIREQLARGVPLKDIAVVGL